MKKSLLILLLLSYATTNIVAASININIVTGINPTEIKYNLFYKDNKIEDKTKDFKIYTTPLNEDGKTDSFFIKATCNLNCCKSISVKINPGMFKAVKKDKKNYNNTKITPEVVYVLQNDILYQGFNEDKIVSEFYLKWKGNQEIPSGEYESNIFIQYSIK